MENKLQEDKKDTEGSSTVLKEYLPEREKNFSRWLKVVVIIRENEVAHSKCDSTSIILHRIWISTYWFLRRIKNESDRRKTSILRAGSRTNNKLNLSIMVQLLRFKHWPQCMVEGAPCHHHSSLRQGVRIIHYLRLTSAGATHVVNFAISSNR